MSMIWDLAPTQRLGLKTFLRSLLCEQFRAQIALARTGQNGNDAFAGIRVVKAFNTQACERAKFNRGISAFYRKSMKMAFYNTLARSSSEMLGMTTVVCMFSSCPTKATAWAWVQEEPENMGAWNFIEHHTWRVKEQGYDLRHVARVESGSPATGSKAIHDQELAQLMDEIFAPAVD